jgi:hypothetical protein
LHSVTKYGLRWLRRDKLGGDFIAAYSEDGGYFDLPILEHFGTDFGLELFWEKE